MRTLVRFLIFTLVISGCNSSPENAKAIEFKVWGNCGMCKKTIEGSLKDKPGIYSADWGVKSKQIKVVFDSTKLKSEDIHRFIASSGYDTDLKRGDDQAYAGLHSCCQYDRKP